MLYIEFSYDVPRCVKELCSTMLPMCTASLHAGLLGIRLINLTETDNGPGHLMGLIIFLEWYVLTLIHHMVIVESLLMSNLNVY